MKNNNIAITYGAIAVASWSTVATAFKIALRHLTHFEMLLIASCTALIIFSITLTVRHKWSDVKQLTRKQWSFFALIGLLNPVTYYLLLFKSYNLLPAQIAQPINYIWPTVLLILLAIFAHKPIPKEKYIGMIVSLSGVVFITMGGGSGATQLSIEGVALAIGSAILWALYWLISNQQKTIDNTVGLFMSFLFGTGYLLVAAAIIGVKLNTLPGILSGIYIGCFEIAIPFICFGLAIRKTSNPALINQMCYLAPFLSLFIISIILGEKIAFSTYMGLMLIVFGIIFNQYFVRKKSRL